MAHTIKLRISEGSLKGKASAIRLLEGLRREEDSIILNGHDVLVFGRSSNCGVCLPEDDGAVSRHHFVMEVNPPAARIRDFGSLNGTYVNDRKIGGRAKGQTPDEGSKQLFPSFDLKHGDKIKVGKSIFTLAVESDPVCRRCGNEIPTTDLEKCRESSEAFLCRSCQNRASNLEVQAGSSLEHSRPEPLRCQKCGKDVEPELGKGRGGDYVCNDCRQQAENDPADLLYHMLRKEGLVEAYDRSIRPTKTYQMFPEAGLVEAGSSQPQVPGYEIKERLGKGGCGAVYLATHQESGRSVAIKVLLAKVVVSEKARNDFLREIKVTKKLRHPNVIILLDHGAIGTTFYFVMEYCRRGSLGELVWQRGGKLSQSEASPIMLEALEGLAYCHDQDMVHRDLKPDNLLLAEAPAGRLIAKISDLGLAKNFATAGFSGMTVTGHFAGTYEYMPREQLTRFKFMSPVSDVWSIGATFYHTLTGCFPHDFPPGKDPAKVVLEADVVPIRKRDASISKEHAAVIDRSLATQPAERYQDAREMKKALASVLGEQKEPDED
jgi:hypothetical protein